MPDLIEKQTEENQIVQTKEEAQFRLLQRKAMVMQQSGWFADCQSAAQAVAKAMLGAEFGLDVAMSMQNVQVIKGNPSLKYIALGALVKRSGRYWWQIKPIHRRNENGHLAPDAEGNPIIEGFHSDEKHCVIEFFRIEHIGDGRRKMIKFAEESFTIEDAAREGLTNRPNWKTMPKIMCRARCISRGVNTHCSDVLGGAAYVPEDFGFSSEASVQVDSQGAQEDPPGIKKQKKKKIAPKKRAKREPAKAPPSPQEEEASPIASELDDQYAREMAKDEEPAGLVVDADFTDKTAAELDALPF